MTKYTVATLSLFVLIFGSSLSAAAIKPRPPLELTFLSTAISEEETKIILTARTNIKTSKISMGIDLPLGLSLLEGKLKWEGPLKRGKSHQVVVVVQGKGSIADEILGNATIHLQEGGTFMQKIRLILNILDSDQPKPAPPVLQQRGGGSVLEFRGR